MCWIFYFYLIITCLYYYWLVVLLQFPLYVIWVLCNSNDIQWSLWCVHVKRRGKKVQREWILFARRPCNRFSSLAVSHLNSTGAWLPDSSDNWDTAASAVSGPWGTAPQQMDLSMVLKLYPPSLTQKTFLELCSNWFVWVNFNVCAEGLEKILTFSEKRRPKTAWDDTTDGARWIVQLHCKHFLLRCENGNTFFFFYVFPPYHCLLILHSRQPDSCKMSKL